MGASVRRPPASTTSRRPDGGQTEHRGSARIPGHLLRARPRRCRRVAGPRRCRALDDRWEPARRLSRGHRRRSSCRSPGWWRRWPRSGSLYFSEVANYEPCRLCWFQRIAMYPLAVILLVGWLRRDRGIQLVRGAALADRRGILDVPLLHRVESRVGHLRLPDAVHVRVVPPVRLREPGVDGAVRLRDDHRAHAARPARRTLGRRRGIRLHVGGDVGSPPAQPDAADDGQQNDRDEREPLGSDVRRRVDAKPGTTCRVQSTAVSGRCSPAAATTSRASSRPWSRRRTSCRRPATQLAGLFRQGGVHRVQLPRARRFILVIPAAAATRSSARSFPVPSASVNVSPHLGGELGGLPGQCPRSEPSSLDRAVVASRAGCSVGPCVRSLCRDRRGTCRSAPRARR